MHLTKKGCGIKIISAKLIIFLLQQKKEKYIFKQVCILSLWKYKVFFTFFLYLRERKAPAVPWARPAGLSRHDSNYWWLITILSAPDYTPYVSTYHTYHTHSRQYQNLPHVFLHTVRTILYLIKQYLAFLCSFVFSYFASFLFISCACAFYVFVF